MVERIFDLKGLREAHNTPPMPKVKKPKKENCRKKLKINLFKCFKNNKDLDIEIIKMIDEHFWELLL